MVFELDELGKGTITLSKQDPPPKTTELNFLSFKHDVSSQREVTVQGEKQAHAFWVLSSLAFFDRKCADKNVHIVGAHA